MWEELTRRAANRLAGTLALPAPTPPQMRVRTRRSQMLAASALTAPALGQRRAGAGADRREAQPPRPRWLGLRLSFQYFGS